LRDGGLRQEQLFGGAAEIQVVRHSLKYTKAEVLHWRSAVLPRTKGGRLATED
jgi:hypothetical protein